MICKELELVRNTTKAYEVNFTKNGTPEDITGWTVYFTVKSKMSDSDLNAKIKKAITTHDNPTTGVALIELTASDTDIVAGNYYYSIDYKDADGNIGVLYNGRLLVREPVLNDKT